MILRNSISAFSVLLIMAATAVVGLMTVPFLRVQYAPPTSAHDISVTFSMPGASASVIEEEVTSLIEGVLAGVSHCRGIRSVSRIGRGRVNVSFDKNTDMAAARFEVASRIRSIRDKLPECCSYPDISLSTDGLPRRTAIVYYIRSARTSESIASVSKKLLQEPLSCIEGVSSVILSGNIGFHQVITFDANACEVYGVSPSEVAAHLREAYSSKPLWRASEGSDTYNIRLKTLFDGNIEDIPVAVKDNRVVRLGDIASVRVEEEEPESYFRLNGLNAVSLSVFVSDESNLLKVVEEVRSKVEEIRKGIPDDMSISVGYDYSEYLDSELNKIYRRTALCVMILLLLVFLTTHSWRYTLTTAVTLVVNVLISIALYGLFRLPVHIYTLAGITVSLGIIIDNSIVMIDHYYRNRNKSIFPAIVASVLTTVAALAVTILLPDAEKNELADFCKVIILNLSVSLITAHLFIPALMDRFFKQNEIGGQRLRRTRAIASFSRLYSRYVSWGTGHRGVCILIVFAAFGLPFCLIPEPDKSSKPDSGIRGFYFSNRYEIDRWLGSSFALFYKSVEKSDFYREQSRPVLTIRAGMPEGCSISQLNEVVGHMESFLARFDEIEIFETSILSPDNAELTVMFKPEYENSGFPSVLKAKVMKIAIDLGGANWRITGVDNTYFDISVH